MAHTKTLITIYRPNRYAGFVANWKKKFIHFCVKQLKDRGEYPKFWVMPYDPICREILESGFYEKELLLAMQYLAKDKNGIAVDVGANIGNHTIFFSRIFPRVIAFEPVPRNCWILKANLHLNRISNVTLVEKGLGAREEFLLLVNDDPENTNDGFNLEPIDSSQALGNAYQIAVVRGDYELEALGVSGGIAIIKIDVEGFEPQVLQGLEKTILKHRPIIFWEAFTHETANTSVEILQAMGYRYFYHITTNKFDNRLANKLSNAFGKAAYLIPLDECKNLDGMNVAMMNAV